MGKVIIIAALFLAMVALASAYTTTITTTVIEENNRRGSQQQRCREQFQEQQKLSHCQMYLQQGSRYSEQPLRMVAVNPRQQQEHQRQCCQQLENIDEQCRCDAIREMVRQQQQQGEMEQQQMQKMAQMAMNLPRQCEMEPQQCQIRTIFLLN